MKKREAEERTKEGIDEPGPVRDDGRNLMRTKQYPLASALSEDFGGFLGSGSRRQLFSQAAPGTSRRGWSRAERRASFAVERDLPCPCRPENQSSMSLNRNSVQKVQLNNEELQKLLNKLSSDERKELTDTLKQCTTEA
ncbi:hypothetical protein ANCDUO_04418 [Ancylostoma duodenale]|uniref:Uncharacterized protein n=1 Tax=Ancylostoma duodenale TaxID=51022 RepID=A0A0C2H723_9BILA|nr:hypothetical protein ANCDUO_04418 [Ancylostoma duodenale]